MGRQIPEVILRKGREKSLLRRHPWVFSGAIERVEGDVKLGDEVRVFSSDKRFLGYGTINPNSQIVVRMWSFSEDQPINRDFIHNKLQKARELREKIIKNTDAIRIFFSESDGIPGLIVDKYANLLVCQFLSAGVEVRKGEVIEVLKDLFPDVSIYERSDSETRKIEGLGDRCGFLIGSFASEWVEILENQCRFLVDYKKGHKTGFYIDQRDNREKITFFSQDKRILNCFSYTGGFTVYALKSGAKEVVNIDDSQEALHLLNENLKLNGLDLKRNVNLKGDAFRIMRDLVNRDEKFDVVILDPPKFITQKGNITSGARGYKDINMLALRLLRSGGFLFTFSCSGLLERDLFQKIISDAAVDAKRDVRIISYLSQGGDHPIKTDFPESLYLKGFICEVE